MKEIKKIFTEKIFQTTFEKQNLNLKDKRKIHPGRTGLSNMSEVANTGSKAFVPVCLENTLQGT